LKWNNIWIWIWKITNWMLKNKYIRN
jgi:hypothetical protein